MATQSNTQIRTDFVLAWTLATTTGLTLAGLLFSYMGWAPLLLAGVFAGPALAWSITGALIGVIVGFAQWLVLRRYIHQPANWILSCMVGWAVTMLILGSAGVPILTHGGFIGFDINRTPLDWAFVGAILGLASGFTQIFILPLPASRIGTWLALSVVGWTLGFAIGWPLALSVRGLIFGPFGVVSGIISGAITGWALSWLFASVIRQFDPSTRNATASQAVGQVKTARFTTRDRLGGIGLFGIGLGVVVGGTGETSLAIILLVVSVPLLLYALVVK